MEKFAALEAILRDGTRSPRDRAIARAALDKAKAIETGIETDAEIIPGPMVDLPEAVQLLAALGKKYIGEVSGDEWVTYFAKNHTHPSEALICEWNFFVAPDARALWLLTGLEDHVAGLRWWWETSLATCGERADVRAFALRQLAALP